MNPYVAFTRRRIEGAIAVGHAIHGIAVSRMAAADPVAEVIKTLAATTALVTTQPWLSR